MLFWRDPSQSVANGGRRSAVTDSLGKSRARALRSTNKVNAGHLLVMGGYSHPKWLEFIFGGATQSILLSSKIPVLVSH
jgi:nucleotide-binding universal stress UspA family protein